MLIYCLFGEKEKKCYRSLTSYIFVTLLECWYIAYLEKKQCYRSLTSYIFVTLLECWYIAYLEEKNNAIDLLHLCNFARMLIYCLFGEKEKML